ncbi:hypothetical protein [Sinisalibacter aestuarii]|uniref:Uncharacterized protein n=1 Tax=Sinisalibacter aestuarii TaxID=2949426 RepID=A0ABQ5LWH7_9RHOB|nr:hypothetical protein [Sinisalibacter aestuarii]GKY88462.1 hypothetical protein STA1M1_23310 [Sinisalibacter aestuarii]
MTGRKNRAGIAAAIALTIGAAAWSYATTQSGQTVKAGLLGSGMGGVPAHVATTADGNPEGFTGSDEELKAIARPRPSGQVASTASGTPEG